MNGSFLQYMKSIVTISFLIALLVTGNAFALPCNGQTANIGETMKQVAAKCGEAILKEHRTVEVEESDEEGTAKSSIATEIDEWTYDTGPEEIVQSYRFENNRLVEISNHGYGTVRDFSMDTCRNGGSLSAGDSMIETYLKCGDPLSRDKLNNKIEETESGGTKRMTSIPLVEWTYRYGPDAPGYTVTFENGVAVEIRTREFGK